MEVFARTHSSDLCNLFLVCHALHHLGPVCCSCPLLCQLAWRSFSSLPLASRGPSLSPQKKLSHANSPIRLVNYDGLTRSSQMTCCPSCRLQVVVLLESVLLAVPRCQVWPMISGYDRLIQYQKMTNNWYFHATLLDQLRHIFC